MEVLDEVTPLAPPPRRGSLVKPIAILPVEPTALAHSNIVTNNSGTFHYAESSSPPESDKVILSRSNSMSTQDHDDQYSPTEIHEEDEEELASSASVSSSAKATPTIATMMTPDPIHAFSLSPPSSVVSLGLVSS